MSRDARQVLTELLVPKAQGGDERAFGDLYRLWSPDLRRLALVQIEHAGPAEEVAQDAWVTIARGLRRLQDPACFPRWAFRILERRCVDWIRRRQTERQRAAVLAAENPEPAPVDARPGEAGELGALREAIARLDPDARKLLHLFYELGFSVTEIAGVLDVPAGTVKSRLFTLRENLKQQMERNRS
jgi:RNA polymerase sigma-70 factor (ECF subfamily)